MPTHLPRAACFDLETTARAGDDARDPEKAVPVQAAVALIHPAGTPLPEAGAFTSERGAVSGTVDIHTPHPYPELINPGFSISAESSEVHGITDQHVVAAVGEAEAVERLVQVIRWAVGHRYVLIAANAHYDFTVLDRRLRARHPDTPTELGDVVVFDPMVIDRWADKFRKGKRTLTDLCEFYAVPLDDAHDAGADALAAGLVVSRIFDVAAYLTADERMVHHPEHDTIAAIAEKITTPERFQLIAQMGAEELHAAQTGWRAEWARGFQTWLREKAPADRRDPNAVVCGAWPMIPAPAPVT